MKKKLAILFGALLIATASGGLISVLFQWMDNSTETKRRELAALPPGTRLLCSDIESVIDLFGTDPLSDSSRIVTHWKLVKVGRGGETRWYVMDLDRKKMWQLERCKPIETPQGKEAKFELEKQGYWYCNRPSVSSGTPVLRFLLQEGRADIPDQSPAP